MIQACKISVRSLHLDSHVFGPGPTSEEQSSPVEDCFSENGVKIPL